MTTRSDTVWTADRIDILKSLWPEGYPASYIAGELGPGISRNAVIGKAMRLGLGKKTKGHNYTARPKRTKPDHSIRKNGAGFIPIDAVDDEPEPDADPRSVADLEAQAPPASFLGITFAKLNDTHCRYIRTIDGVKLYCGQAMIKGSSYCRECHRRCHSRAWYALNVRRAA